jgi:hypothetical protein
MTKKGTLFNKTFSHKIENQQSMRSLNRLTKTRQVVKPKKYETRSITSVCFGTRQKQAVRTTGPWNVMELKVVVGPDLKLLCENLIRCN